MLIEQNFELRGIDFHSTISLLPQKIPVSKFFDDVIACDLRFWIPPIKNPGYAYA